MTVRAAGGLVMRWGTRGWEILVVHRPRYDDWSLPKGKEDPGETSEETALREVWEETGVRGRILAPLDEVTYRLTDGRDKVVTYFAMTPTSSIPFEPNEEVDDVRWISPADAPGLLTYLHDSDLVAAVDLDALVGKGTLRLLRHAAAGSRTDWTGDNRLRPLSRKGMRQAEEIAESLAGAGIERILSSPYARCLGTVEPLAARIGIEVELVEALAEGSPPEDVLGVVGLLAGSNALLCSHGDVIPDLLGSFARCGAALATPTGVVECRKGSVWTVGAGADGLLRAEYRPPPAV